MRNLFFRLAIPPLPLPALCFDLPARRRGDFSQTLDVNGRLNPVIDPLTRRQFPGDIAPADRISTSGLALLSVFP
jgi:hypothetical protein